MDSTWSCLVMAFFIGAAYAVLWVKGREFWSQWRAAWREERRLQKEVKETNAKLTEGRG